MIVYDDKQPSEKVKIYDKGVELNSTNKEELYQLKVQYRVGDMYSPKLDDHEALALETQHFVDCISNGRKPLTGGRGHRSGKVLVAAQESLKNRGCPWDCITGGYKQMHEAGGWLKRIDGKP
jgi:hypothetical protein